MRTVFDAGRQRWMVGLAMLVSLVCAAGLVFAGGYMLLSYGLQPEDGGVLKPLASRVLTGGAFAVPGAAIAAGVLVYLQCYVTRIEADDAGNGFLVTLAGIGRLTVRPDDVVRAGYVEGRSDAGGVAVNAPWYSVRLRGRRLPLIVDLQGDFLDAPAVDRLIQGEPGPVVMRGASRKLQGRKRRR